jgi:hypothetical protein
MSLSTGLADRIVPDSDVQHATFTGLLLGVEAVEPKPMAAIAADRASCFTKMRRFMNSPVVCVI